MSNDVFSALEALEKEKGIPREYMLEKISQALLQAYKKDNNSVTDNIVVESDEAKHELRMYAKKTIVEAVETPALEINLDDAKKYTRHPVLGDIVNVPVETKGFGRIAAQAAKQVIIQGIREKEMGLVYARFSAQQHEILTATVNRIEPRNGNLILELGTGAEKTEILLPVAEQIKNERLREGDKVKIYVVEVTGDPARPKVLISRTHPGLVKRLFELQVPEIRDGLVEIKSIAREAGSRTKIAVYSSDKNIDAVGACVGPRGDRVGAIVSELGGEKIDIVQYNENTEKFIAAALAPAEVISVEQVDVKNYRVVVPDDQLSLAIGKEGQNARLAVKLTGCKIDIKSRSIAAFDDLSRAQY
ncbi:MAG: transcription termination/antitermination protein NusA [Clostridiales bacterium]|nr:transcription termination/antitermination protein NusA [Clostridiales bacterium]